MSFRHARRESICSRKILIEKDLKEMNLSEKKAKEILTFLAKKAGFDSIGFFAFDGNVYLGCLKKSKSYFIGWVSWRVVGATSHVFSYANVFNELKSSRKSYMHFLEMMLDIAKSYDIKTCGSLENGGVVMRKGTTLEELLIELDLLSAMANMEKSKKMATCVFKENLKMIN